MNTIDLSKIDVPQLHQQLKDYFGFPDYYGANWDALWDMLHDMKPQNLNEIRFRNFVSFQKQHPKDAKELQEIFETFEIGVFESGMEF